MRKRKERRKSTIKEKLQKVRVFYMEKMLIDRETGEMAWREEEFKSEKYFAKMFSRTLIPAILYAGSAAQKVLWYLIANVDKYSNIIYITTQNDTKIRTRKTEIKFQDAPFRKTTLNEGVNQLKTANVIRQVGRGIYMINPNMFCNCVPTRQAELIKKYRELKYTELN